MNSAVRALAAGILAAGCALPHSETRPVYHPATSVTNGERVLVVGVERDPANRYAIDLLARELALALARRGRSALDLTRLSRWSESLGRPLPPRLIGQLERGVADADSVGWLVAERVRTLIFLEIEVYEQAWAADGKRTRVGLAARGRDLSDGESLWRAYATPEIEDEPGRGFELATESALAALARVISGEPEPIFPPALPRALNFLRW